MASKVTITVQIEKAAHLPVTDMHVGGRIDPYVRINIADKQDKPKSHDKLKTKIIKANTEPLWDEKIELGEVATDDILHFIVKDHDKLGRNESVGFVHIPVSEFIRRPKWEFLLTDDNGDCLAQQSSGLPSLLYVNITYIKGATQDPVPSTLNPRDFPKHAMLITRGTRGDIQPFVALARGLAELKGWMVTICTEIPYKGFVKQNGKVSKGCIRFRPCGGDTSARVDEPMAKWAMNRTSEFMQVAMLSRSEAEFFASEPAFHYWATTVRPDVVVFGFTLANIALVINESLKIPIVGFILQPTCIPSKAYSPIVPIDTHSFSLIDKLEERVTGHGVQQKLRSWVMENNIVTKPLTTMRGRRGLPPLEEDSWTTITNRNVPLVVPIDAMAFGGAPPDWSSNAKLTTFIFLRTPSPNKPKEGNPLPPAFEEFIREAKVAQTPVVVMAFSSMPVARQIILQAAVTMTENCQFHPRVIALVGPRDLSQEKLDEQLEQKVSELKKQRRILEEKGAPFGDLFPHMSCIVVHGGLGTTAEAMRVGVPVMVTGVLLMDQRFWGQRVFELGIGPKPCHVRDFSKVCAENLNKALDPVDPSGWRATAKKVAAQLAASGFSEEGVIENVDAVDKLSAKVATGSGLGFNSSLCSQAAGKAFTK